MSFPAYILKVNLAIFLCWTLYVIAFRKFTFFRWNRFYLLGSVVLSFILPLFRLPRGSRLTAATDLHGIYWEYVDQLVGNPVVLASENAGISLRSLLLLIYLGGVLVLLTTGIWKYLKIRKLTVAAVRMDSGPVKVYMQDGPHGSFTLFRRIYLDRHVWENKVDQVLRHEMVHASQNHSIDLLIMTFAGVLLWFNPFVFLLMRYARNNHEYLADEHVLGRPDALAAYLVCLRDETIRRYAPAIASYFRSSTIKKRIIMLTSHPTKNQKKWRYLATLPIAALIMVAFQAPPKWEGAIPSAFPLPLQFMESVTWGFNEDVIHPITGKVTTHLGLDIAAPEGTPVYAAAEGIVKKAENLKGWGNLLVLEHAEGYTTFYAHMKSFEVKAGDKVTSGQEVGSVGNTGMSTGHHLHYEVRKDGVQVNPSDYY
ncbi:MAG: peptidoglycan DD-metalloendopeptidase family protein [Bacteroidota bacterium]